MLWLFLQLPQLSFAKWIPIKRDAYIDRIYSLYSPHVAPPPCAHPVPMHLICFNLEKDSLKVHGLVSNIHNKKIFTRCMVSLSRLKKWIEIGIKLYFFKTFLKVYRLVSNFHFHFFLDVWIGIKLSLSLFLGVWIGIKLSL